MPTEKSTSAGAPIASCDHDDSCTPLSCAACLVEIPLDVALTFEGPDYVQHFCGLECLETWKQKQAKKK